MPRTYCGKMLPALLFLCLFAVTASAPAQDEANAGGEVSVMGEDEFAALLAQFGRTAEADAPEPSGEDEADPWLDFPALDDWDAAAATPEPEETVAEAAEELADNAPDPAQDEDETEAVFAMEFDDDGDFASLREEMINQAGQTEVSRRHASKRLFTFSFLFANLHRRECFPEMGRLYLSKTLQNRTQAIRRCLVCKNPP